MARPVCISMPLVPRRSGRTLGALAPVKAIFSRNSLRVAMLVTGVALIAAVPILRRQVRHRHDRQMTSSCGNHAIQLRFLVLSFVDQEQRFPLESDARTAFVKMRQPGEQPDWWFKSVGSACPESFLHDKSIGYVFVADGLSTKTAVEQSALVFFCPADNHQRSVQHCHAVIGRGELLCIKSNVEMIELLRREIGRAKQGIVPYSTNALSKMERELKARGEHARRQGPNRVAGRVALPAPTPPSKRVRTRRFRLD